MTDNGFSSEEPEWLAAERAGGEGSASPASSAAGSAEPAAAMPASAEPASAEPASAEPASAEPASAGPASAGPGDAAVAEALPGAAVAVAEPVAAVSKASIADIEEAMKDVVDPELGINVVDLGLVYDTFVDDDNVVTIDMTLTSAACPLTDVIEDQTRSALTTGPGGGLVKDFRINWVWLPPWGPDKITDDGREQLRALGFNV
jgi:metal-sulfur cluster biosynthetic enzyme